VSGVVGLSLASAPAGAGAAEPKVLVLAIPTLGWADLHRGDTPNLDRLLDDSAVASIRTWPRSPGKLASFSSTLRQRLAPR
jgi:hypothetical protein